MLLFSCSFQECTNTCPRDEFGKKCSNHGNCSCGVCICDEGWTGRSCSCKKDHQNCRNPNVPDKICSGHGDCKSDRCACDCESGWGGKYCDIRLLPTECELLRPCVECKAFGSSKLLINENMSNETKERIIANCSSVPCPFDYDELIPSK